MVNDPLDSTVTQFARTPVTGRPYTISETNHPYPHEYACEGFPILTAYALFHDWDGIYWFTYGQGRAADPKQGIRPRGWFDFSNDPVKMTTLYACALMWYRQDLRPARRTVVRSYTMDEAIESLRMDRSKGRPFFKPGFARSTPLQHATRFQFGQAENTPFPEPAPPGRIEADTGQLVWHDADKAKGVVTVDSERTQALIGFVRASGKTTVHLSAQVDNEFCCLLLTSMDDAPIRTSRKLLLTTTALVANTGIAWEDDRKTLARWGRGPVLIEPVTGTLTLRDMGEVKRLTARPLTAAGSYLGPVLTAKPRADTWRLELDGPTTWYVIEVQR